MGNLLAECRRCSIDQCELCTEVLPSSLRTGQRGTTRHVPVAAGSEAERAAGAAGGVGRRQDFQPTHMSEAALLQQAIRNSQAAGGGEPGASRGALLGEEDPALMAAIAASYAGGVVGAGVTEEELVAQAIRRAKNEEESRQRQRLRDEQEDEYEESLRIDQQRELEKALRKKEEEEAARRAAEDEEERRMKAEQDAAEVAAAEAAKKKKTETAIEEARSQLSPELEKGTANLVQVMVKLPDGRRLKRGFSASDTVAQIYHFANAEGGEGIAGREFRLVSAMPRSVYEDRESTLEAAGLQGQCALLMESLDEDERL